VRGRPDRGHLPSECSLIYARRVPTNLPGGRAAPLDRDDRRTAIVDAVLPVVGERGIDVTSRELADAAGVAEGTLFRAFGTKHSLVGAVAVEGLRRASGADQTRAELAAIDRGLPLEQRLALVIELGRRHAGEVVRWLDVLRALHHRTGARDAAPDAQARRDFRAQLGAQREEQRAATIDGLTDVLMDDAPRLRVPVAVAVALVESSVAGTHGQFGHLAPVPPADVIADVLVHGLMAATETTEP
jgi:AcrR family transcriptional regulator